ncbi:MAG: hypothetical protein ABEI98_07310 [Halorhabdus sp.]
MLPERSHWVALAAMGGAVVIQGVLDVTADTSFSRAVVIVLCGLVLIGSGSIGFVRSHETPTGSNPVVLRAVTVGGAVLYIGLTVLRVIQ